MQSTATVGVVVTKVGGTKVASSAQAVDSSVVAVDPSDEEEDALSRSRMCSAGMSENESVEPLSLGDGCIKVGGREESVEESSSSDEEEDPNRRFLHALR